MQAKLVVVVALGACWSSKGTAPSPGGSSTGSATMPAESAPPESTTTADSTTSGSAAGGATYGGGFAKPPPTTPVDAAVTQVSPPQGAGAKLVYRSDCSTTHPIARDVCQGTTIPDRGLKSCTTLHVKSGQACKQGAATCFVERTCGDGRVVPADFLECSAEQSGRCFTRSSRIYKEDIAYLDDGDLDALATQIEQLRLARFRYKDSGEKRLGFIIEDAPGAAWVTADGRRVDLYSLLSASIAAIQRQDARIRQLEHDIEACKQ